MLDWHQSSLPSPWALLLGYVCLCRFSQRDSARQRCSFLLFFRSGVFLGTKTSPAREFAKMPMSGWSSALCIVDNVQVGICQCPPREISTEGGEGPGSENRASMPITDVLYTEMYRPRGGSSPTDIGAVGAPASRPAPRHVPLASGIPRSLGQRQSERETANVSWQPGLFIRLIGQRTTQGRSWGLTPLNQTAFPWRLTPVS